jgi:alkylation response protein AidB-like acyl-CoA dehydrogenase
MSSQLGLHGLLVPEEFGGQGASLVEMAVVLEETGRALLPAPFLPSAVLAVSALLASGDGDAAGVWLPAIASGDTIAAVAFSDGLLCRPRESTAVARAAGSGWEVSGRVDVVLGANSADLLLVVADLGGGESGLFAVPAYGDRVAVTPLPVLDLTREAGSVELDGVPARRIGGDAAAVQREVLAVAAVALSAEMAGATGRALEIAVDYAGIRHQFNRPIGSFQAVKHACADIFTVAESATAVARNAARVVATDPAGLAEAASLAKAYTSAECPGAAERVIQVHGGIGFTWEHPAHLYLRRVRSNASYFGDAPYHRARLAHLLGLTASGLPPA